MASASSLLGASMTPFALERVAVGGEVDRVVESSTANFFRDQV
jgi:hypothetical protein